MKDYLKTSWWENQFPKNPTQTHYIRFFKSPENKLKTKFTESEEKFDRLVSSGLQTTYSEFLEN